MNKKIDTETVKQQTDGRITAGRVGRYRGDKRSNEALAYMHTIPSVDLLSPPYLPNFHTVN